MKKKVLNIIIAFICISLTGIVAVQYFWIRNAFQVREAQFNRSVNDALGAVVNKLETREDIVYMKNHLVGDSIHALVQSFSEDPILSLNTKLDSLLKSDEKAPPPHGRGMPMPGSLYNNYPYGVLVDMDSVFRHSQHFDIITQEYSDGFSFEFRGEFDSRQMDSILLLNEKRLVAIGTHQSLLEMSDYYRSVVACQQIRS